MRKKNADMSAAAAAAAAAAGEAAALVKERRPRVRRAVKAVGQVMSALKSSKSTIGPTMTDIFKFISSELQKPATKRQVVTALKRGVEFGILKRKRGHYRVSPDEKISKKKMSSIKRRTSIKKSRGQTKAPVPVATSRRPKRNTFTGSVGGGTRHVQIMSNDQPTMSLDPTKAGLYQPSHDTTMDFS